jgi:UDP-N-acetylglucosamine 2-epimerase (non-hydrolysing)
MKVMVVFGTRPEAIKLAPLIHELRKSPEFDVVVSSSGQHREMLKPILKFFEIVPNYDLKLMSSNQSLQSFSCKMIKSFSELLNKVVPDICIVQGDTTTTFIGALCSFYKNIPVGHVEAGLRSYNKMSPFPEEINRILTTSLTDLHFAPTKTSINNLLSQGINKKYIYLTGNTAIDALLWAINKLNKNSYDENMRKICSKINFNKKIILVTAHRRESFGKPLLNICHALLELSHNDDIEIVYPVHLNPNVKNTVYKVLSGKLNIHLLNHLSYEEFVWLMNKSYLILTDSGGIQEEAPTIKKPVLVMREVTERMEGIESGVSKIVGTKKNIIIKETNKLLNNMKIYNRMASGKNPYGDGMASSRIKKLLENAKGNYLK